MKKELALLKLFLGLLLAAPIFGLCDISLLYYNPENLKINLFISAFIAILFTKLDFDKQDLRNDIFEIKEKLDKLIKENKYDNTKK